MISLTIAEASFSTKAVIIVSCILALGNLYYLIAYATPQKLVQLVLAAHSNKTDVTHWNIKLNSQTREALCTPLTKEQLAYLDEKSDDIISKSVTCYLISKKYRPNELSGVVSVSIHIRSKSGLCDVDYDRVRIRIVTKSNGKGGFEARRVVEAVELLSA